MRQKRQRIGDFLILLLSGRTAPIDLMEHLAVLDKQHSAGMARRLDRMRYHDDRLTAGVDVLEQMQQLLRRARIQRAGRSCVLNKMLFFVHFFFPASLIGGA